MLACVFLMQLFFIRWSQGVPELLYCIRTEVIQALLVHMQQSLQAGQARCICGCCCLRVQHSVVLPSLCSKAMIQVCVASRRLLCILEGPAEAVWTPVVDLSECLLTDMTMGCLRR